MWGCRHQHEAEEGGSRRTRASIPPHPQPLPSALSTVSTTPAGPKAWPATMGLISFFALSVYWQALFPILSGKA
jgi:hypothetical protein